jgi:hypothetical protein
MKVPPNSAKNSIASAATDELNPRLRK